MNKIFALVLLSIGLLAQTMQCMDESPRKMQRLDVEDISHFQSLPPEIKCLIISFIPKATSIKEIYAALARLSLVNREGALLASDPVLLRSIFKRYIELNHEEAMSSYLQAAVNDDPAQEKASEKILAALVDAHITVNLKDAYAYSQLFKSALTGNCRLIQVLIDAKIDLNFENACGATALMLASSIGQKEVVRLLLDNGADYKKEEGAENISLVGGYWTAIRFAAACGQSDIVELFLEKDNSFYVDKALREAITAQRPFNPETVKILLEKADRSVLLVALSELSLITSAPEEIAKQLLNYVRGQRQDILL